MNEHRVYFANKQNIMLRDVYGDSVDKIVQGNTSNIIFLKSTDDSMIDTLQKMSGTTHRSYTDSKTVTRDNERLMMKNEGKTSYTMTTREEPVIKYNDMAFIGERNSIVFRAGDNPIWNRNETILPMSWRLFQNTIKHPGHSYSLQTIPTLSTVKDFDVRKNQPDFGKMLDKRIKQALESQTAQEAYRKIYNYNDYQIEQLDPDDYADEIMEVINIAIREGINYDDGSNVDRLGMDDYEEYDGESYSAKAEANPEQEKATKEIQAKYGIEEKNKKKFAKGTIAPADLVSVDGNVVRTLEEQIVAAYKNIRGIMDKDSEYFVINNGNLCDRVNGTPYIKVGDESESLDMLNKASEDGDSNVFAEDDISKDAKMIGTFMVTDAFFKFLASQNAWKFADGKFDEEMAKQMTN